MKGIVDSAGDARRAWLRNMQEDFRPLQSDFEKSLAFRLTLLVAAFVIGINLFSPPPQPVAQPPASRATV